MRFDICMHAEQVWNANWEEQNGGAMEGASVGFIRGQVIGLYDDILYNYYMMIWIWKWVFGLSTFICAPSKIKATIIWTIPRCQCIPDKKIDHRHHHQVRCQCWPHHHHRIHVSGSLSASLGGLCTHPKSGIDRSPSKPTISNATSGSDYFHDDGGGDYGDDWRHHHHFDYYKQQRQSSKCETIMIMIL